MWSRWSHVVHYANQNGTIQITEMLCCCGVLAANQSPFVGGNEFNGKLRAIFDEYVHHGQFVNCLTIYTLQTTIINITRMVITRYHNINAASSLDGQKKTIHWNGENWTSRNDGDSSLVSREVQEEGKTMSSWEEECLPVQIVRSSR